MRRILFAAATVLMLAGCVQTVTPQQTAQIKSLAIVTGFGEQIELNHGGLASFASRDTKATVDWQIDRHFRESATALLANRYQMREISYDPLKLVQGDDFFTDPAIPLVRSVVGPGTVDAVLYFGPLPGVDRSDKSIPGNGLGLLSHRSLASRDDIAFTAWRAAIFDGRTLTILGQAPALLPLEIDLLYLKPKPRTPRLGSGIAVPDRYEELSPEQRRLAREMIFALVDRHLPNVLRELNLR